MLRAGKKNGKIHAMPWLRVSFLIFVLAVSSGYRFRCYAFCTDQTSTQNDYIEQRDRCREYAELKVDMRMRESAATAANPNEPKSKQVKLVSLFNECMSNNGWNIVDAPKGGATPPATPNATTAAVQAPVPVVDQQQEKASLSRSAECMFARHAAANSTIAAARAKACDLECSQRLAASPEAPRPAACPADVDPNSNLTRGWEREE